MALDLTANTSRPLTASETLSGGGTQTTVITVGPYDREVHVRCDAAFNFRCGATGTPDYGYVPADADVWTQVYARQPDRGVVAGAVTAVQTITIQAASGTTVYVAALTVPEQASW